jgi:hypothetical protein
MRWVPGEGAAAAGGGGRYLSAASTKCSQSSARSVKGGAVLRVTTNFKLPASSLQ